MNSPAGGIFAQFYQPGDPELRLTKQQFAESILGYEFYGLNVANRSVTDGFDDYAERTFIWGGTQFKLGDATEFVFRLDGEITIENFSIEPLGNDNFNFEGSDNITNLGNDLPEHAMDPSGIGRIVNLNFSTEARATTTYSLASFQADQATAANWTEPALTDLVSAMNGVVEDLFNSGITATIVNGKAVIYGSDLHDSVSFGTNIADHYDIAETFGTTLLFGNVDFYLHEYTGNGIIYVTGDGEDYIEGTNSDDEFLAGDGVDTIWAKAGNDWIDGGAGADVIDGGAGTDVLHFDKTGAGVTVNLAAGTGAGGDAAGDSYSNIEVVIGTNNGDHFIGGGGARYAGGLGNDVFDLTVDGTGISGPTVIWGGAGSDTINIGAGATIYTAKTNMTEAAFAELDLSDLDAQVDWSNIDVVILNPESSIKINMRYTINDENGDFLKYEYEDLNVSGGSYTIPTELEDPDNSRQTDVRTESWNYGRGDISAQGNWSYLVNGEAVIGDDTNADFLLGPWGWSIVGGYVSGTSISASGSTTFLGSAANDTHSGSASDEMYAGSLGGDAMNGGGGTDTAFYKTSAEAVDVNLASGLGAGGDAEGDTYSSIENVIGSDFNDTLTGDASANVLNGGAGDDSLTGGAGDDTFVYTSGNDTIAGNGQNHGVDTLDLSQYTAAQVSFRNAGSNVEITTPDGVIELNYQILRDVGHYHANIEHVIFSDGNLDEAGIRARAVSDQSSAGGDTIVATKFEDILNGGAGDDILTGGSGADIIELDFGSGSDTMTDFEDGLDIIDLSATGLVFSDLTIADNGSGDAVISFDDGDGATALDELTLTGITAAELTAADFQFG